MKMKKIVIILIGFVLLIFLCLCNNAAPGALGVNSPYLNHHDSVKYVGAEQCAQCHQDKAQTFLETGMGKSFDYSSKQKSAGRFINTPPVYDSFLNLYYLPYWQGDQFMLKEYRLVGKDTVHKRIEKISYIIGSGHHTNSHFTEENGYVFQAPITFYTQNGQWDLPPGFEGGHNTRFSRKIGMECMSCHNSLPETDTKSENKYRNLPHGISCERCHGPGEIHVREKGLGRLVDTSKHIDYTIVNPRKLSWQRQIDICQRCHLQGNAVLKTGKTFADFRPGMKLSETFDQFSPEYEEGDKFIMAAHAERFQKSKCFLSSVKGNLNNETGKAGFTCITCHNPHISVRKTNVAKFNSTCKGCHTSEVQTHCTENQKAIDMALNNCVKCHMPGSGTADIPHVSVHDHYIRKPEKAGVAKPLKLKGLRCITNDNPDNNTVAEAYISYFEKFDNNALYLKKAKEQTAKLNTQNNAELKTIIHFHYISKNYSEIIQLVDQEHPIMDDAWSNYRIAKAYENMQRYAEAKNWMDKCLAIQPDNLDFILQNGILLMKNKEDAQAKENFERLNQLYTKNAECWAYMGIIHLKKSEFNAAQISFNRALQLNPDLELALENLKLLYQTTGNSIETEKIELRLLELKNKK